MYRRGRMQRYILSDLLTPTMIGVLLYTFVLLMNHLFFVAERALSNNLSSSITLRLLGLGIPQILVFSIPMAVLLGTLIGLGRLSADREWIAIQAAGGSARTLMLPVLVHGALGTLACLALYHVIIPQANYALRDLNREVIRSGRLSASISPRTFQEVPGGAAIFYVDDVRPDPDFPLVGVILIQPDPGDPTATQLTLAQYGNIYYSAEGHGAMLMDLQQVASYQYQPRTPESIPISRAGAVAGHRHELPSYFDVAGKAPQKTVQDLTLEELLAEIALAESENLKLRDLDANSGRTLISDYRVTMAKIEFHRRFAIPLASIVFAILALPLGLTTARSGKGAGFAISVIVILVYRVVFVSATKAAATGNLPPWAGAWMSNAVILLWALVALWRMRSTVGHGSGEGRFGRTARSALDRLRSLFAPPGHRRLPDDMTAGTHLAGMAGSTSRFVGRLDRYLGLAYLRTLLLSLASAYLLFAIVEGQGLVNSAMRNQEPLSLVGRYLLYYTPAILTQVMPIAALVGAVVTITLLSRSSELVAVRAAGVSMRRVTAPILVITAVIGGLSFVVQDRIAPVTNRHAEEIRTQVRHSAPRTYGVPADGSWRFGDNGETLYHYRAHDSVSGTYEALSIFSLERSRGSQHGDPPPPPRIDEIRYTDRAVAIDGEWELNGGWHRDLALTEPTIHDAPYRLSLDLPHDLREEQLWLGRGSDSQPDQVSVAQIRKRTEELRNGGYNTTRFEVAFQRRLSQPLAPLVMVLLGLPFGFRVGRRGSLYGIGVALILVLVYWSTFAVFNALGLQGLLPPYVAAWTPNVLFGLLGSYLLLYVRT